MFKNKYVIIITGSGAYGMNIDINQNVKWMKLKIYLCGDMVFYVRYKTNYIVAYLIIFLRVIIFKKILSFEIFQVSKIPSCKMLSRNMLYTICYVRVTTWYVNNLYILFLGIGEMWSSTYDSKSVNEFVQKVQVWPHEIHTTTSLYENYILWIILYIIFYEL